MSDVPIAKRFKGPHARVRRESLSDAPDGFVWDACVEGDAPNLATRSALQSA
jgi:hypothetical protein